MALPAFCHQGVSLSLIGDPDAAEPNAFRAMMSKTLSQLRDKGLIDFDREWVIAAAAPR